MRAFKVPLFIVFFLSVVANHSLHAQALPSNYSEIVNKWIKADNARTKPKGAPYAEVDMDTATIYIGDVDSDGDDDIVADYGVTYGGNAVTEFLTVFVNNNGKLSKGYEKEVGMTGRVMLDSIAIENGFIVCTTSVWKKDDAQCCPSGEGAVKYVFRKGKIKRA
jgi:hypothetical protein